MKNIQTNKPDLVIEKLKIWIHGRQFPDASDYWDVNWLNVTTRYDSVGSFVEASGHIIHLSEIVAFLESSEKVLRGIDRVIELTTVEPNIGLRLECDKLGYIKGELNITHDHMSEKHEYTLDMDQSYLPGIITLCKAILVEYPIRGDKPKK